MLKIDAKSLWLNNILYKNHFCWGNMSKFIEKTCQIDFIWPEATHFLDFRFLNLGMNIFSDMINLFFFYSDF